MYVCRCEPAAICKVSVAPPKRRPAASRPPPARGPRGPRRPASRKTRKKPTLYPLYPSRAFTVAPLLIAASIVSTLRTLLVHVLTHTHAHASVHTSAHIHSKSLQHDRKNRIVLIYKRHEHELVYYSTVHTSVRTCSLYT